MPSPKTCRGQYSIQLEMARLAHSEGRLSLLADKTWRDATYTALRDSTASWCDGRRSECHCEPDFKPPANRHRQFMAGGIGKSA